MATSTSVSRSRARVPRTRLVRAGVAATLAALVAVLAARSLVGALYAVDPTLDPFRWAPIIGSTVASGVGATVVYALLDRYTERPVRNFLAVAGAVLLAMFVPLVTVAPALGVDPTGQILLGVLHVVVAATVVAVLLRLAVPGATGSEYS
ncbi:DUF6069 family protein [Halobium salinum]|uniref:DUF6069 family protein n=1 Tax=Halobium salinum TaxID=1364940 RepID=A0ABD5PGX1_9EURY|nr:DUF6069 family protein [Halobium salinum]